MYRNVTYHERCWMTVTIGKMNETIVVCLELCYIIANACGEINRVLVWEANGSCQEKRKNPSSVNPAYDSNTVTIAVVFGTMLGRLIKLTNLHCCHNSVPVQNVYNSRWKQSRQLTRIWVQEGINRYLFSMPKTICEYNLNTHNLYLRNQRQLPRHHS